MASLLHDTPLNQFQQEAVRMITSSGDLLSTVVDDVLDYSKLQSGDFSLNIQKADLQMTMDSVTTAIQMKADQTGSGIWIRSYIGTTVPQYLDTDAKRLQQILYNLMGEKEGGVVVGRSLVLVLSFSQNFTNYILYRQ